MAQCTKVGSSTKDGELIYDVYSEPVVHNVYGFQKYDTETKPYAYVASESWKDFNTLWLYDGFALLEVERSIYEIEIVSLK